MWLKRVLLHQSVYPFLVSSAGQDVSDKLLLSCFQTVITNKIKDVNRESNNFNLLVGSVALLPKFWDENEFSSSASILVTRK